MTPLRDPSHHWADRPHPVPQAVEQSSESLWAQFQAISDNLDAGFARTVPSALDPAAVASGAAAMPPAIPRTTLDEALSEARRLNRVCPMPDHWKRFHARLPVSAGQTAPISLEGRAWQEVPAMGKRLVLRDQLAWAQAMGTLEDAVQFLRALNESDWQHIGD